MSEIMRDFFQAFCIIYITCKTSIFTVNLNTYCLNAMSLGGFGQDVDGRAPGRRQVQAQA